MLRSLWFDHIKGWYEHRSLFNIQFMMYEEMKKVRNMTLVTSLQLEGSPAAGNDGSCVERPKPISNLRSQVKCTGDIFLKSLLYFVYQAVIYN